MTSEPAVTGEPEGRGILIARLRGMADWLEAHPEIPLSPHVSIGIHQFADSEAHARQVRKAAGGGWVKQASPESDYVTYVHGDGAPWSVKYFLNINKAATSCERVQVGTLHVEAHDEPVWEWRCGPQEAEPSKTVQLLFGPQDEFDRFIEERDAAEQEEPPLTGADVLLASAEVHAEMERGGATTAEEQHAYIR